MEEGGIGEIVVIEGMEEGTTGEVQGAVVISEPRMPTRATVGTY